MRSWAIALAGTFLLPHMPLSGQQGQSTAPVVVIQGSETPELIPDREAFRSLFSMLGDRPNNPPAWEFRSALLQPAGLTKDEEAAVVGAANIYSAKSATATRAINALREATPHKRLSEVSEAQIDAVMTAQGNALDQTIHDLENDLGPAAYQRLLSFVRTWKKNMAIVPGPKFN